MTNLSPAMLETTRKRMNEAIYGNDPGAVSACLAAGLPIDDPAACAEHYTPLIWAVLLDRSDIVRFLAGKGANLNAPGADGGTAMHMAVSREFPHLIPLLASLGADCNPRDRYRSTPLSSALISYGTALKTNPENASPAIIRTLLEAGADPNLADGTGRTALIHAADDGLADIIPLLAEFGAKPNALREHGGSALHAAVRKNRPRIVSVLASAGADCNLMDKYRDTPLLAALSGHESALKDNDPEGTSPAVIRTLLEAGADPNFSDSSGQTPLIRAIGAGLADIIPLLAEFGADLHLAGDSREIPLTFAARRNDVPCMSALIKAGAKPNFTQRGKKTSALQAAAECGHVEATRLLLAHGAKPGQETMDLVPAPVLAALNGHVEVLGLLLRAGAPPETLQDAFQSALRWEKPEVLRPLIAAGANPDAEGNYGKTPLMAAAENGKLDIMAALLDAGCAPNLISSRGKTALMAAASGNQMEAARLLIERGADPALKGEHGNPPLHAAILADSAEMVTLLCRAGASASECLPFSSPLDSSLIHDKLAAARALLACGADPNEKTVCGTLLTRAVENGKTAVARLLVEYGANPDIAASNGKLPLQLSGTPEMTWVLENAEAIRLASGTRAARRRIGKLLQNRPKGPSL